MIGLLAAFGCAPSAAERFAQAMAEPDFDRAIALCMTLDEDRTGCATATVARFARWERCATIPSPGECHFLHADALGLAGDPLAGLRVCTQAAPYVEDCTTHLLGLLAFQGDTVAEAEQNLAAAKAVLGAADARPLFLRMWFRHRLETGLPLGDEGCPDVVCRRAARHVRGAAEAAALRDPGLSTSANPTSAQGTQER